jgi:hypothetical protein
MSILAKTAQELPVAMRCVHLGGNMTFTTDRSIANTVECISNCSALDSLAARAVVIATNLGHSTSMLCTSTANALH